MFTSIGHKILAVVGAVVTVGLLALVVFYAHRQEASIIAQNERTMIKVTESVTQGLKTVMLAGHADISQTFSERLKDVAEIAELYILRIDGSEAFRDNDTIRAVNEAIGVERFPLRREEAAVQVLPADHEDLREVVSTASIRTYYETGPDGSERLTLLAPVTNQDECQSCHLADQPVRGVLKLTTSLASVEADIRRLWTNSMAVLAVTVALIMIGTNAMVRVSVVRRIHALTNAMERAADGDLSHAVADSNSDELGDMARSFNLMTKELLAIYSGLRLEQNKLTTILLGSRDGIVVADPGGKVVLVNPAAEALLGKTRAQIEAGGFLTIFDDPIEASKMLASQPQDQHPSLITYKQKVLSVHMASIRDGRALIGSAALFRDVTEEKRLQAELERLSLTDPLTSLYNRRYFDRKMAEEFALASRTGLPLSLLLFDVDHFKRFNDTYGHDQGDRVLQTIAEILRSLRTSDFPCRYGGEEFAVILPGTSLNNALVAAERLRAAVAARDVDGLRVTVSIGVASAPPLVVEMPEALVKAADKALYAAKQAGRNRVCAADPQPAA